MGRFLNYIFLLSVTVALSACVMIFGWGLHPRSWWWIIGGGVFAHSVIRAIFDKLEKEGSK
jgi:hypothetical protein